MGVIWLIGLVACAHAAAEPVLEGRVLRPSGAPVAGAQVLLFDLADLGAASLEATADESGAFTLPLGALGLALPERFELGANYPNPFNPSTLIPYQLPAPMRVRLEVFNLLGQRIATLVDGQQPAGFHTAAWDATDAAGRAVGAGVYLYRLSGGGTKLTRRMLLLDGQAGIASATPGARPPRRGESMEAAPGYGLAVSGPGLIPYVDPAFPVTAGMAPVEVVLEAPAAMPRAKVASSGGILGDVDNSGRVSLTDLLLVALYSQDASIVMPNSGDIWLGDVDADGQVGLSDIRLLYAWLLDPSGSSLPAGIGEAAGPAAALSPDPSTVSFADDGAWHRFTVQARAPVSVVANPGAGTPRLQITPLGGRSNDCPAEADKSVGRRDGEAVYLSGCAAGEATVELRRESDGTVLRTYTFEVTGRPDLVVESISASDSSLTKAQSFTLRAIVRNQGTAAAAATTLRWYRSNDATITTRDSLVGTDAVSLLAPSGTSAESVHLTAPSSEGTYYYGACVVAVAGEADTRNSCSGAVTLTVVRTFDLASDREALVALYHATDGPNWTNSTNWLSDRHVGDWYGVVANGRVTWLELNENQLSGSIPAEVGNLTHLESLSLGYNQLTGPIPPQLGQLTRLEFLTLSDNHLTDPIPPQLGQLTNLDELDLVHNRLSGPIPSGLGNLTRLTRLVLADNWLTGPIPSELGNLARLDVLALGNNQLTGPIPPELGNLANLTRLELLHNPLTGVIPPELGQLTNLVYLILNFTDLSGPLPRELIGLPLQALELCVTDVCVPRAVDFQEWLDVDGIDAGCAYAHCRDPEWDALSALYHGTDGPNWTNRTHWLSTEPTGEWYGVTTDAGGRVTELNLEDNNLRGILSPALGGLANLTTLNLASNPSLSGPLPQTITGLALDGLRLQGTEVCAPPQTEFQAWLKGISGPTGVAACTDRRVDYYVLVELLNGTDGASWTDATNWGSATPLHEWHGVSTDSDGRVTELILAANNLRGPLPTGLGQLLNLSVLILDGNQLTGEIPSQLGQLTNLSTLFLDGNQLTGEIPSQLGQLTNLSTLFLEDNQLTGEIPPELGQLANLSILSLAGNRLTGEIPPELGQLANLLDVDLSANPLRGEIPSEMGQLARLESLSIWGSALTGEIPPELGQLTNLRELLLVNNVSLTGPIPPELGQLTNLELLWLSNNDLTGEIPPDLGHLTHLGRLDLSANQLTGEIPPTLGQLTDLGWLDFSANQLTGEIPPTLGQLTDLGWLDFSANQLTGEIPPTLGQLTDLGWLDFSANQLTGEIPSSLGQLTILQRLDLSTNQLTGNIPPELGDLLSLESLNLAYNGALSGTLPQALTRLNLADLSLRGTFLCPPPDADFQAWVQGIPNSAVLNCARQDGSTAYLTQAAQSLEYPVPLVADEAALLRVFVTAAQEVDATLPPVRATFYRDGAEVHTAEIDGQAVSIPWQVNEGDLSASANALVPGSVVRPGTEMVVEIDPDQTLDPDLGVGVRLPETGRTLLDVRSVLPFDLTLIPFLWTEDPDSTVLAVTDGLSPESDLFRLTRDLLPVRDFRLTVHEPVWTSVDPTSDAGAKLFPETDLIYAMEGASGYYMGILRSEGRGGLKGIAHSPGHTSLSILSGNVIAHELGHNLSLGHSPGCGPDQLDPDYPYEDGSIGVWGYDFLNQQLVSAGTSDLMTYCEPQWISDYSFAKALGYRSVAETPPRAAAKSLSPPRGLLLWGGLSEDGELFLEPAFVVRAASFPPRMDGPYRLTGEDEDGDAVFTRSFGMAEISCGRRGGAFAFILPVGADWSDRLVRIVLSGPEGVSILDGEEDPAATLLLDRTTGRVRGLLRDWAEPAGPRPAWETAGSPRTSAGAGAGGPDQPRPAGPGLVDALMRVIDQTGRGSSVARNPDALAQRREHGHALLARQDTSTGAPSSPGSSCSRGGRAWRSSP